jgi:hypothetical protein
MSWSWFSPELVRIQRTELGYRVKGDATYLALHDFVRSDGEPRVSKLIGVTPTAFRREIGVSCIRS